jgi:dTDP-L-rhamnose 4-epimerase
MLLTRVLITGGAGFIGSHLADALLAQGCQVRILDTLTPQVHGPGKRRPAYLARQAELVVGDVGDPEALRAALPGVQAVIHLAAVVGVGQSMDEIAAYVTANTQATATMLQVLSQERHAVRKLIVASSMSIYGEGQSHCPDCGPFSLPLRSPADLAARRWNVVCPRCSQIAQPAPTPETKPVYPTSVYAITKRDQEELCLCIGQAYRIPTVALRYFNVYGERQSLSNPYTGVAAIFSSRLLNGRPPLVYEDGEQSRDFTHVSDVVRATLLALMRSEADYEVFNVGTGRFTTVAAVARKLAEALHTKISPQILDTFRQGDIRHCVADIGKISRALGFRPRVSFTEGMERLVAWTRDQAADDRVSEANGRLRERGLVG